MGSIISTSESDSSDSEEEQCNDTYERVIDKNPDKFRENETIPKSTAIIEENVESDYSETESSSSDDSTTTSDSSSFFGDSSESTDFENEVELVEITEGMLYTMGNPLLDISANVGKGYLEKYGLKENDAILAEDKHKPMYTELIEMFPVEYIAGGATQNSCKVAQWMLGLNHATTFVGCIGKDKFGEILEQKAEEVGVKTAYYKQSKVPTGTCAALICGHNRSLCANLSAANEYKKEEHLDKPEVWAFVEKAKYYYIAGFFLTVSIDSIVAIGKHAADTGKIFTMNLSAPFLSQFFKDNQLAAIPYIDVLFGNETEAEVFSEVNNFGTKDLSEIAKKMAAMTKVNSTRQRIVVITHGEKNTIIANGPHNVKEYPVIPLSSDKIVDTNGAGDAFVGGFLSQLVQGKEIEECVKGGNFAANLIIQRSGCTFPEKCSYGLN